MNTGAPNLNCSDESVLLGIIKNLTSIGYNSGFKKAMLIQAIESKIKRGSMTPKILCFLELVGELDYTNGNVASEKMREAYCAVALDCAAIHLEREDHKKYAETVQKIWRDRIRAMGQQGFGLVDGKTLSWVDIIQGASSNAEFRDLILSRNRRYEAVKAIKSYLAEAYKEISPSILEKTAELMVNLRRGGMKDDEIVENVIEAEKLSKGKFKVAQGRERTGNVGKIKRSKNVNKACNDTTPSRPCQKPSAEILHKKRVRPRKTYTRWTIIEEVVLMNGVEEFGVGQWELILNKYRNVFKGRTGVNLKDKWRTITE